MPIADNDNATHQCAGCAVVKSKDDFYLIKANNKLFYPKLCKVCYNLKKKAGYQKRERKLTLEKKLSNEELTDLNKLIRDGCINKKKLAIKIGVSYPTLKKYIDKLATHDQAADTTENQAAN